MKFCVQCTYLRTDKNGRERCCHPYALPHSSLVSGNPPLAYEMRYTPGRCGRAAEWFNGNIEYLAAVLKAKQDKDGITIEGSEA